MIGKVGIKEAGDLEITWSSVQEDSPSSIITLSKQLARSGTIGYVPDDESWHHQSLRTAERSKGMVSPDHQVVKHPTQIYKSFVLHVMSATRRCPTCPASAVESCSSGVIASPALS